MKAFTILRVAAFLSPFVLWAVEVISATWCWVIFLILAVINGLYCILTVDEDGTPIKQHERILYTWTVKETGKTFSGYILDTNDKVFVVDNQTKDYFDINLLQKDY